LSTRQEDLAREERRSIVVLGLLAILVAYILSPYRVGDVLVNAYVAVLLIEWIGYTVSILVYFSDDMFPSKETRLMAKKVGLLFLFGFTGALFLFTLAVGFSMNYPSYTGWIAIASVFGLPTWFIYLWFRRIDRLKS
jgi:hypothetical protein